MSYIFFTGDLEKDLEIAKNMSSWHFKVMNWSSRARNDWYRYYDLTHL